ncbi:MAG: transposase [Thermoplasmatota archaeon]
MRVIAKDRLLSSVRSLETFVNDALDLHPKAGTLSGLEYLRDLLAAAAMNTYVETVGDYADSLHRAILAMPMERMMQAYLNRATVIGARFNLATAPVILAFDHTEEDYYGELTGPWMHTWTGEHAVSGKWKFYTCAIVNPDGPKVPLLSIPTPVAYDTTLQTEYVLNRIQPLIGPIQLTLFDRGFYHLRLLKMLSERPIPYLMLVPSNPINKRELATMREGEKKTYVHDFEFVHDKTTHRGTTTLALLKDAFDRRRQKKFDWTFATNQPDPDLDRIIGTYKGRWRIETGFRVQDQAHIHSSSQEIQTRYFYFALEQALQFTWSAIYKDDAPFKGFLYQLWQTSAERVQHVHTKNKRLDRQST